MSHTTHNEILFEGWLQKRGHVVKSWRTRWFVVKGNTFTYYKDSADAAISAKFKGAQILRGVRFVKGEMIAQTMSNKTFNLRHHVACDTPWEEVSHAFEKAVGITTQTIRRASSDQMASDDPTDQAATHVEMGLDFVRAGLIPQAIYNFNEAVRLDPASADAFQHLGSAQFCLGDYQAALKSFEMAKSRNPRSRDILVNHATLLYLTGYLDAAKDAFRNIERDDSQADKKDPDVHNNLGTIYAGLGELDEAVNHFQVAMQHSEFELPSYNSTHFKALLNLGRTLLMKGDTTQATQCFQKCIRYDDQSSDALIGMGEALLATGSAAEAEESFEKALKHEPSNEEAQDHLAKIAASKRASQNAALRKSRRDSRRKMRRELFSNSDSEADDSASVRSFSGGGGGGGGGGGKDNGAPNGTSITNHTDSEAGSGNDSEYEPPIRQALVLPPDPHDPLENLARTNLLRANSSRLSDAMSPGGRGGARVGFRGTTLRGGSRGGGIDTGGGGGGSEGGVGGRSGFVTTTNLDLETAEGRPKTGDVPGKRSSSTM